MDAASARPKLYVGLTFDKNSMTLHNFLVLCRTLPGRSIATVGDSVALNWRSREMLRYFIAGNLWMLVSILLLIGREAWRTGPVRYGFLGVGSLSATVYNLVVAFCVIAAAIFFLLAWKTQPKQ